MIKLWRSFSTRPSCPPLSAPATACKHRAHGSALRWASSRHSTCCRWAQGAMAADWKALRGRRQTAHGCWLCTKRRYSNTFNPGRPPLSSCDSCGCGGCGGGRKTSSGGERLPGRRVAGGWTRADDDGRGTSNSSDGGMKPGRQNIGRADGGQTGK